MCSPKKRVLVVDGDPNCLAAIRFFLTELDFDVVVAETIDAAIAQFEIRKNVFDVLLLDLMFGERRGEEIFYFLGFSPAPTPSKIIVISRHPEEIEKSGFKDQVFALLHKPVQFDVLLREILRAPKTRLQRKKS